MTRRQSSPSIAAHGKANEQVRQAEQLMGAGPVTASAVVATVGDFRQFTNAAQFGAWLAGITPRGDVYLCVLLILARGLRYQLFAAKDEDCQSCTLRAGCLKNTKSQRGRQVTRFEAKVKDPTHPSERMRQAIDSPRGRQLYSQRIGTVEPVFANIRHNKRLTRLNHRGRTKVNTQWNLYCMVHNIEKLAKTGIGQCAGR